jgi:hypothetical protein
MATTSDLIFSQRFGKRSFNMDIPERAACMEALYTGQEMVSNHLPESVANIIGRYADVDEYFPAELRDGPLPYFVDWLIESVHLVEITAYSDGDAYTIFETMNDRGLSLSPADMLEACGTSASARRSALGDDEIDRNQKLLAGSTRPRQPGARLDVTAGLLLKMEPGGRHPGFELRGISEEQRVQYEIAVGGVRGDRQVGGAGVEVDGLRTGQDDSVAVGCEHGQRVK